jgi:hypothetical protein
MWMRRDVFRSIFDDFYMFDWVSLFLRVGSDFHLTEGLEI